MDAVWDKVAPALAKHLGPVSEMFLKITSATGKPMPLRADVKQLPLCAFKALLTSDALQVQMENDPYALLRAWVYQSCQSALLEYEADRLMLFKELAPVLRYHHMTSDFLGNVVSQCLLMQESGLLPAVMRAAFGRPNAPIFGRKRGKAVTEVHWQLKTSFTLLEVATLGQEGSIWKWCGLVGGYPAGIMVKRLLWGGEQRLDVFVYIDMPHSVTVLEGAVPRPGVRLKYEVELPPDIKKANTGLFTDQQSSWGFVNPFQESWVETVREGSPHFPEGVMGVKAKVWLKLD